MKYTPTPLERMSFTTCTTLSVSCLGMPLKSRCASSKKNTNLGLSGSPTSGRRSKSVESIQSRNMEYTSGVLISLEALRMLT